MKKSAIIEVIQKNLRENGSLIFSRHENNNMKITFQLKEETITKTKAITFSDEGETSIASKEETFIDILNDLMTV